MYAALPTRVQRVIDAVMRGYSTRADLAKETRLAKNSVKNYMHEAFQAYRIDSKRYKPLVRLVHLRSEELRSGGCNATTNQL